MKLDELESKSRNSAEDIKLERQLDSRNQGALALTLLPR